MKTEALQEIYEAAAALIELAEQAPTNPTPDQFDQMEDELSKAQWRLMEAATRPRNDFAAAYFGGKAE